MADFPNPDAGEFTHRINQVPDAGRRIIYHDHSGAERGALVVDAPKGAAWHSIGDDRRLQGADHALHLPSKVMVDWRYATALPTERMIEIAGYTDALRQLFADKEQQYKRAGMQVDHKDRAEWVVAFLLEKDRAKS